VVDAHVCVRSDVMPLLPSAALRSSTPAEPPSLWTSLGQWFECCVARDRPEEEHNVVDIDSPIKRSSRRCRSVNRNHMIAHHALTQSLHDTYEVDDEVLGKGGFGIVRRIRFNGSGHWSRVVKTITKHKSNELYVKKEIGIIRNLDHPCICRLYETFEDDAFVYLVMEYIEGVELFDYISSLCTNEKNAEEGFCSSIMRQVFSALQYCHNRSVIHRDLKPENIMIKRIETNHAGVKLIDFGLATIVGNRTLSRAPIVDSQTYLSPEAQQGCFSPASDMWSSGLVLHVLLVGGLPENGVLFGEVDFSSRDKCYGHVSPSATALLDGLLRYDARHRMTAEEAVAETWNGHMSVDRQLNTVPALVRFHKSNKLRRAAMTAVAMQADSQYLNELEEQFLKADIDGSGQLDKEEITSLVKQSAMGVKNFKFVENIFESLDTDGSGKIEYTEWLAAVLEVGSEDCESAIIAAFNVFDHDRNGTISGIELGRILMEDQDEIAKLLPQFDTNGDGELDFLEFKQLLMQTPLISL